MLPTIHALQEQLHIVIANKREQGHAVEGLHDELDALPASYDALSDFARKLADLPLRDDWPYVEPNQLEGIWAECDPDRPLGLMGEVDLDDSAQRVEAAFLGSVCGCILGKPLEIRPTLDQIRSALESIGEWPGSTPISPAAAGASTNSTSSCKDTPSGVVMVSSIDICPSIGGRLPHSVLAFSRTSSRLPTI